MPGSVTSMREWKDDKHSIKNLHLGKAKRQRGINIQAKLSKSCYLLFHEYLLYPRQGLVTEEEHADEKKQCSGSQHWQRGRFN